VLVRDAAGAAGVVLRVWEGGALRPGGAPADGGWAAFEAALLVTCAPLAPWHADALRATAALADYVAPAAGADLLVGFLDGTWWCLAVRPGARLAADPAHVLYRLDEELRPRVDADALRTLLGRVWTRYDAPRAGPPGTTPDRPAGRHVSWMRAGDTRRRR
jgi:hypothetical protein